MFAGLCGEDGGRGVPVIWRGYENGVHTFNLQYFPEVAHLLRFDAGTGLDQLRGVVAWWLASGSQTNAISTSLRLLRFPM